METRFEPKYKFRSNLSSNRCSELNPPRNKLIQHRYDQWNSFGRVACASWAISDFSSKTSPKSVVQSKHLKVGKLAKDQAISIFTISVHSYNSSQSGPLVVIQQPNNVFWVGFGFLVAYLGVPKNEYRRSKVANRRVVLNFYMLTLLSTKRNVQIRRKVQYIIYVYVLY